MPVKNLILTAEERYPILLDEDGVPDYWVVTEHLRQKSRQTSIENTLSHLVHFKLWEKNNSRSLVEELSKKSFLSDQDIYSLRDHCRLESKSLKQWHENTCDCSPPYRARLLTSQAATSTVLDLRLPLSAETDSPSAFNFKMPCFFTLMAALMSRSATYPHSHVHDRIFSGISSCL